MKWKDRREELRNQTPVEVIELNKTIKAKAKKKSAKK